MKKSNSILLVIFVISWTILSACGGEKSQPTQGGASQTLDRPAPPADYASKKSPGMSDSDIENGKRLYQVNCASCHGEKGMGDGPSAAMLKPKPTSVAETASNLSDAYLFWRISEGGLMQPFKSAMPAWKSILAEDDIWQVIGYMRALGANQ
jgi:mono/diheme cytochrome c family protein